MTSHVHLLLLSEDPATRDLDLFADPQGRRLPSLPPGVAVRRVLAVPGGQLSLHRVKLNASTPAQAQAAAWHLLEGRLASDRRDLALTAGATGEDRWVAVFEPAAREHWLARAAAHGFTPDAMVPDCLLLPEPGPGAPATVAAGRSVWRVRDVDLAFSTEPALAVHVLASRPRTVVEDETRIQDLLLRGAGANATALDLLPVERAGRGGAAVPTRRLAILAAAVLLSPLLVWAAQGLRHELAADRLTARAEASLVAAAPQAAGPGRALPRARAALALQQAPDRFGRLAAALLEAQAQVPGTRLQSLRLDADGVLAATWEHAQSTELELLRQSLAERGVDLAEQASQPHDGGWLTTVLLSEIP